MIKAHHLQQIPTVMRNMYYVDMHCHSAPKPYSWSLKKDKRGWDCRNVRKSIWYNDPPRVFDKFLNRQIGLTRFTQSDLRTLSKGEVSIFSAAFAKREATQIAISIEYDKTRCVISCEDGFTFKEYNEWKY